MSEEDKRIEMPQVLNEVMLMVQHYTNHINYEMLKILHMTGYCNDYTKDCHFCNEEAVGEEE